jgi:hypothetical protein
MGHESHDSHGHTNPNATPEPDTELPFRIRPIEFIKHNPNLFNVPLTDVSTGFQILGGGSWAASTFAGAAFGYWYYAQKIRLNPATFYTSILLTWSRVLLGGAIGGWAGYMKFGDRQRLHNAWVSERLRRRYPDALNIETHDLWRFKDIKANQHFYKWT